jgi:hypothetical protein
MADPLSIAAAAAGFFSLAGQFADGLIKLKDFCDTIKNAPREVAELCDEMDTLRRLLEEAGARVQESLPPGTDASYMQDAFAQVEKTRFHAVAVLDRLQVGISKGTTMGIRFPFKKKEIVAMLLSVERGKTSLLLANQAFESYVSTTSNISIRNMSLERQGTCSTPTPRFFQ